MSSINLVPVLRKSIEQAEGRKSKVHVMPSRSFLRKIMRIEKAAGRMAWYEILSCGHRGRLAEGPNREYVPFGEMPKARICKECAR